MCKFNNRLFVFSVICLLGLQTVDVLAKPLEKTPKNSNEDLQDLMALTALLAPQDNYDLHYDQRQKGEENYRVKLDGFFIGLPEEESSALFLLSDEIFANIGDYGTNDEYILAFGKNNLSSGSSSALASSSSASSSPDLKNQKHLQLSSQNSPNNHDTLMVEIPSPKKQSEARHRVDIDVTEEFQNKPTGSRTRSYITHLVNLLKRGRKT